jgi:hypothetical protein
MAVAATSEPVRWLGAPSAFGLALPDATPSPSTLYAPRGIWLDDEVLVVADTGNHRVLVWHGGLPTDDHAPADVVLGQPDRWSEGPGLLHVPTGLLVTPDRRLVVCDAWHHRLLVWDAIPTTDATRPDHVIGQDDLEATGEGCGPTAFYWPFGIALVGATCWVADTGNRRVLGWHDGVPEPGQAPDVLLGQDDLHHRGENRDGPVSARSFRWPHAVAGEGDHLFVADAGNHRVLGWVGPVDGDRPADLVLGQPLFERAEEYPYRPQGPSAMRFPYGVAVRDGRLAVADTSNNRVLVWDGFPAAGSCGEPADRVLGQPDMGANGENRWSAVVPDSLCWPYGIHWQGAHLAVADSGNNRATVWELS